MIIRGDKLLLNNGTGSKFLPNISELDAEVLSWKERIIANGGGVSNETLRNVNTFVKYLNDNDLRKYFVRLNVFLGDNIKGVVTPLFFNIDKTDNNVGNRYDISAAFINSDFSETNGLTGNGSNKWFDTGVNQSTTSVLDNTNMGLLVYSRTSNVTATQVLMGVSNSIGNYFAAIRILSNSARFGYINTSTSLNSGIGQCNKLFLAYRNGTNHTMITNSGETVTNATNSPGVEINKSIGVFGLSRETTTTVAFSSATLNCYAILANIPNDATAIAISNIVNDLYKKYGRNEY